MNSLTEQKGNPAKMLDRDQKLQIEARAGKKWQEKGMLPFSITLGFLVGAFSQQISRLAPV